MRNAFSTFALVFICITEPSYRDSLFQSSSEDIIEIQSGANKYQVFAWKTYSNAGIGIAVAAPILLSLMIFRQRVRAFFYMLMFTFILVTMNIFKLWYHDPRPFWVDPNIMAFSCSN